MAVVNTEAEFSSSLSASKLFKMFRDFDNIAPKADPQMYKAVSSIEGDGGVGSIKSVTYGDGLPFTSSKHKMNTIDENNLSLSWTFFEGDALLGIIDSATHHVSFIPSAEGGSKFKHNVEYKCKSGATLSEEVINQTKESFKNTFKAMESYAIAHPEAY